jgi:hypothetical protein
MVWLLCWWYRLPVHIVASEIVRHIPVLVRIYTITSQFVLARAFEIYFLSVFFAGGGFVAFRAAVFDGQYLATWSPLAKDDASFPQHLKRKRWRCVKWCRSGMFRIRDVSDPGCFGSGMFWIWDDSDPGWFGSGMIRIRDVEIVFLCFIFVRPAFRQHFE